MTTIQSPSEACCSIPPVVVDYTEKGTYEPLGAFDRVYVTGDDKSETALIIVYDIFAYFSQTLQGADILAKTVGAKVFMPDFFGEGNAFKIEKYPITDETREEFNAFLKGVANPPSTATRLVDFAHVLKSQGFKKIGALGYCWGGVVVFLGALETGSPLDAISIVHPSMPKVEQAEQLSIPLGLYVSKDESEDQFKAILQALEGKPFYDKVDGHYYKDMFHGWAAARANLSDPINKRDYEDLYSRASAFFKKALA